MFRRHTSLRKTKVQFSFNADLRYIPASKLTGVSKAIIEEPIKFHWGAGYDLANQNAAYRNTFKRGAQQELTNHECCFMTFVFVSVEIHNALFFRHMKRLGEGDGSVERKRSTRVKLPWVIGGYRRVVSFFCSLDLVP